MLESLAVENVAVDAALGAVFELGEELVAELGELGADATARVREDGAEDCAAFDQLAGEARGGHSGRPGGLALQDAILKGL